MKFDIEKEVTINVEKLNRMKLGILMAEHQNLKTREKTNDEMIEEIRKIISNEIKKNY